jgi:5-methylcytosine-specific restriction endonuclease McrA
MNRKHFWTKEQLSDLYESKQLTADKISVILKTDKSQILYWLHKYNIKLRPIKLFIKGHTTNVGKKKSLETRNKISIAHVGMKFSEDSKRKMSESMKRTKCHAGKRNGRWIDGRNPLRHAIRHLDEYYTWVNIILKRDNFTCQYCDRKFSKSNLDVHHLIPFKTLLTLFLNRNKDLDIKKDYFKLIDLVKVDKQMFDIDNGITLCKKCHHTTF